MLDHPIATYIQAHVINNQPLVFTRLELAVLYCKRFIAFCLGAAAGVPWLHSADLVEQALAIPGIAIPIKVGVVLSFGATAAWTFLKILESFEKKPEQWQAVQSQAKRRNSLFKHLFCHITGLVVTIPTVYLGAVYNDVFAYALFAGFLAYILSTFGLYHLVANTSGLYRSTLGRAATVQSQAKSLLLKDIARAVNFLTAKNTIGFISQNAVQDTQSTNQNFWLALQAVKMQSAQVLLNNKAKISTRLLLMLSFPLINAFYRGVVTHEAIVAAGKFASAAILPIIGAVIVVMPLLGIDLFSMKSLADKVTLKLQQCIQGVKSSATFLWSYHPVLAKILIPLCLVLSALSAVTNGFLAYDQMAKSSFANLAWLFASTIFLLTATFQSIAFTNVVTDIIKRADQSFSRYADQITLLFNLEQLQQFISAADKPKVESYCQRYYPEGIATAQAGLFVNKATEDDDKAPLLQGETNTYQ